MIKNIADKAWLFLFKNPLTVLFCFWAGIQILLLFSFGIVTTKEAVKYSGEAQNLLQHGHFSEPKYIFYSAYILLHIVFIKLGLETIGVYIVQLLTNLLAMYLLHKTVYFITKKRTAAFISVLLLVLCYSWQYWTVYLYTESFFCSLLIIFSYLLFGTNIKSGQRTMGTITVFILIILARPTGMLLIPVMCCLLMFKLLKEKKYIAALAAVLIISSIFFSILSYAMKGGTSYDFMKPFLENNVLCYIPDQSTETHAIVTGDANSLQTIWLYIVQNPAQFFKLAGLKFISYWGMVRPYYSGFHNLWLMCFFYPLYLFAMAGIWGIRKKHTEFLLYIISVFIIFTLSVILTCDDWNNRFNMPVIPFVMLLAGIGISNLFQKKNSP